MRFAFLHIAIALAGALLTIPAAAEQCNTAKIRVVAYNLT